MSIVHDVAEAIVGDITPHCKVCCFALEMYHLHTIFLQISKEEKQALETNAISEIQAMLGADTDAGAFTSTVTLLAEPWVVKRWGSSRSQGGVRALARVRGRLLTSGAAGQGL